MLPRWRRYSKRPLHTLLSSSRSASSDSSYHPDRIRNFSIIAHVDHGKSTLADRLIELGGVRITDAPQQLDSLQVERERGITVKAQNATLKHVHEGQEYLLNLIDTPGHADFNHEVTRSLLLSDGAVLLVDASQGVQAQTVSHFYTAFERELVVLGALNKIDIPHANIPACEADMERMFDIINVTHLSAKTGQGVGELMTRVITEIPPPKVDTDAEFQGYLHDCSYGGGMAILTIFVRSGSLSQRDTIVTVGTDKQFQIREMGVFLPSRSPTPYLHSGQMGYVKIRVRSATEIIIGDTICLPTCTIKPTVTSVPQPKCSVFSGVFPDEGTEFGSLKLALDKLSQSDTSLSMSPSSHPSLGRGWTLGFLGTLHREVFAQRLHQEFGENVILTKPTIVYRAIMSNSRGEGEEKRLFNSPDHMPDKCFVDQYQEPVVDASIVTPNKHLAKLISLCLSCRGRELELVDLSDDRSLLKYRIPLVETVADFSSSIKRLSSGYASCDFEDAGFWDSDLVKMDVLINKEIVPGLSVIIREEQVREEALRTVGEIADMISQEMFKIIIQCAVGGKIIGRKDIKPYKTDVTSRLYGGDLSRKKKVLENRRIAMKNIQARSKVNIPRGVFRRF